MALNKKRLKRQIVAKKYFKENDPRFITYEEKEKIRMLHESEPEQWPIERLSESFPALPEAIQKILDSKWSPKSVENILRYDDTAIENWKKFRKGKLAVSPILHKHLMKFKDRKFVRIDKELLAKKFIPPKPTFKKPKKKLFSSIVQGYLNEQQDDTKLLSQKDDPSRTFDTSNSPNRHQNLLAAGVTIDNSPVVARDVEQLASNKKENSILRLQSDSNKDCIVSYDKNNNKHKKNENELFTFNEFLKESLKDISNMSPEESTTLMDAYKDHINAIEERQTTEIAAVSNAENNFAVSEYEDNDSDVAADDNLKDTCIKVWKKKIDIEGNYLKPIKITKNIYKPGMTYRISDCYYDDDGEFLYRVPGVQS
ncbi:uncharacterized protein LOC116848910 isoform X2 [Odontomachus brunneus]|nr:uncharacterized protein LOC116848910 isoform X2 [Odontomachus brunneus]